MANNVTHEIKANKLIVIIDISPKACEAAPSSMSGKTNLVGSSGSIKIPGPAGWALTYSINVMGKRAP